MNENGGSKPSVLVVGDVMLDQMLLSGDLQYTTRRHAQERGAAIPIQSARRRGGAALTAELLKSLGADVTRGMNVKNAWWSSKPSSNHRGVGRQTFGLATAPRMPGDSAKALRVQRTLAFEYVEPSPSLEISEQLSALAKGTAYSAIVAEDLNLYQFADAKDKPGSASDLAAHGRRQKVLEDLLNMRAPVLLKTTRPDFWLHSLARIDMDDAPELLVVANLNNIFLSHGLERSSWDRVVEQTAERVQAVVGSDSLRTCTALFLCDQEGLLLAEANNRHQDVDVHLAWDRQYPLGGISRRSQGWVPGCQNVLVATLASDLATHGTADKKERWERAKRAWRCARRAAYEGLIIDRQDVAQWRKTVWPANDSPSASKLEDRVWDYYDANWISVLSNEGDGFNALTRALDDSIASKPSQPSKEYEGARDLAYQLVGRGPAALLRLKRDVATSWAELAKGFPLYTIGNLVALEPDEIKELSRFTDLIQAYAARERPPRPLSLAVFGQPGAGKSFAVKQILQHLGIPSQPLSFNLSQFTSSDELTDAMHEIQTAGLKSDLPVVFWDEFDSNEFDWLRYFLAPMQDGEFASGATRHALGRAVFVFAGGVTHHSADFWPPERNGQGNALDPDWERTCVEQKVPDFASRLKGVYNVRQLGVEPRNSTDGGVFLRTHYPKVLRRALIIRHAFLQHAPQVVRVSSDALDALLWGANYVTARDLENAIESATLGNQDSFGISNLPDTLFPPRGGGAAQNPDPPWNPGPVPVSIDRNS